MASFFKRLKRRLRDEAIVARFRADELNRAAEVTPEVEREVVIHKGRSVGPTAIQVATLAAMLGSAPLRGVKGEPRG